MAKDTFYFSHDYNARNDSKIKKLLSKHGYLGYGLFWAIIEELYNNANALPLDYESIAFDLRSTHDLVKSVIHDFSFFKFDGETFGSSSVEKRLIERNKKSQKARESAFKRWDSNANALRTHCDSNTNLQKSDAIKESKVKEIKENNIEDRKLKFACTISPYKRELDNTELKKFYDYWTEPNKSNTKFRQELEKTWDLKRRIDTWFSNVKGFNPQPKLNWKGEPIV